LAYSCRRTLIQKGRTIEEFAEARIITVEGRLGRLRYIAYGLESLLVAGILLWGVVGVAALVAIPLGEGAGEFFAATANVVVGIGYLVLYVLWTIRRLHDFNINGWFTFIFILPLINFALWLIPGTRGENNYGPMQPPNTLGVTLSALVMPLVFFVLAAIAIPAYQDRTNRAHVAEGIYFANPARVALHSSCQEGNLAIKTDNALLGLASPTTYGETSKVVKSIAAAGLSETSGQVTITFKAVSFAPEGAQIVYRGECSSSSMTWTVTTGGGFPAKYQPRI